MDTYYDTIAESYDELHGEEQKRKFNRVKQFIKGKVLDVGCGTGIVWKKYSTRDSGLGIRDAGLGTWDVTGIDPSKKLLGHAKHIKTILGSGEKLPFQDKSFDTVTCFTAIHNFSDYKKGLEEMKRVSKKIVIITVLKKSEKRKEIDGRIQKMFKQAKLIDDFTDDLYLCQKV